MNGSINSASAGALAIKPVHQMAYVSLGCGIASWFVAPFVGAVVAIITGSIARKEIKAHPELWAGDDYAKWGMILGGVHIALTVITVLGILGMTLFCGGVAVLTQ